MDAINQKIAKLRKRLILIGVIVLILGFGGAVWIYQMAGDDFSDVLGYEVIDGNAYPIAPEDSRAYRHDVERYGGKAALVVDDFNRWFVGLWHGKSLAFTVAGISIFISLVLFFVAQRLPFILDADVETEKSPE